MEKTIEQRRLEFLDETVAFYGEDTSRRALQNNQCMYRTDDGRKCAIGRVIPDELYSRSLDRTGGVGIVTILESPKLSKRIPDNVKELGKYFLLSVQKLHDRTSSWQMGKGLSESGQKYYDDIVERFCK